MAREAEMKQFFLTILATITLVSCGVTSNDNSTSVPENNALPSEQWERNEISEQPPSETAVVLTASGRSFTATLLDNETARQFIKQFPLTLNMSELNGNEKYFYMDKELSADSYQPEQIRAGDLMLYGKDCLVLFYKDFSSNYSYTQLGSVNDPAGLAEALGAGDVKVTFSVSDDAPDLNNFKS